MDKLLKRGDDYVFFVDEIFKTSKNYFSARVIPDIDSQFFPPFHTRTIHFPTNLLNAEFYFEQQRADPENNIELPPHNFKNKINQGIYYKAPYKLFQKEKMAIPEKYFIDEEISESLEETKPERIKLDSNHEIKYNLDSIDLLSSLNTKKKRLKKLHLYCFNVGQGDCILLITESGNTYLIDTNITKAVLADDFVFKIQSILKRHKLSQRNLKGLIITHKHLDHIRGADYLINQGIFKFESILMNYDYQHQSPPAQRLADAAYKYIPERINLNRECNFIDCNANIKIINPTKKTSKSKDIHNSCICLQISIGKNNLFLTGDTHNYTFNKQLESHNKKNMLQTSNNLLKVSHHGSRTGTNKETIILLNPQHSFISAGRTRRPNHPHAEVTSLFNNSHNLVVTNRSKMGAHYIVDKKTIKMLTCS